MPFHSCAQARDAYFACLDTQSAKRALKIQRKEYEAACPDSWVKHFDKKREEDFKLKKQGRPFTSLIIPLFSAQLQLNFSLPSNSETIFELCEVRDIVVRYRQLVSGVWMSKRHVQSRLNRLSKVVKS